MVSILSTISMIAMLAPLKINFLIIDSLGKTFSFVFMLMLKLELVKYILGYIKALCFLTFLSKVVINEIGVPSIRYL